MHAYACVFHDAHDFVLLSCFSQIHTRGGVSRTQFNLDMFVPFLFVLSMFQHTSFPYSTTFLPSASAASAVGRGRWGHAALGRTIVQAALDQGADARRIVCVCDLHVQVVLLQSLLHQHEAWKRGGREEERRETVEQSVRARNTIM